MVNESACDCSASRMPVAGLWVYRDWHRILPGSIGVYAAQLRGRGDRLAEPSFLDLPTLIESLTEAIKSCLDEPFAFFGHSMGHSSPLNYPQIEALHDLTLEALKGLS
jgi:surfactin synthase thioesterase subunit